jgi:hypothetical protein
MFQRFRRYRRTKEQRRRAELESEVDSLRRQLRIRDAEVETLSLCLARDRERIRSEIASYAKATAETK